MPSRKTISADLDKRRKSDAMRRAVVNGAALCLLTFISYVPALRAGYVWDDNRYLTENVLLESPGGLRRVWFEPSSTIQYYPLVFTTFWFERRFWGLDPFGYHFNNVLLHAVDSLLVVLLLCKLRFRGAWLAGLLFALHPVHVESVAWIAERKDVLSALFFLLALVAWSSFLDRARWPAYVGAFVLFLAALLSKATTAPLPAVLLLITFLRRNRLRPRDLLPLLPYFIVSVVASIGYAWLEKRNIVGSPGQYDRPLLESILIAGRALWFYAGKLLLPCPLMTIYPKWNMGGWAAAQVIYPVLAVAPPILCFLARRKCGKGPLIAVCYFGLMLAPALAFVPGGFFRLSFVSDHFQYLASIGPLALLASFASLISEKLQRRIQTSALAILALSLGVMTWRQSAVYKDSETLWRHNTLVNDRSAYPFLALGNALARKGEHEDALDPLFRAVELDPDSWQGRKDLAEVLRAAGRWEDVIEQYEAALTLRPEDIPSRVGLSIALGRLVRLPEAAKHLQSLLAELPDTAPDKPDVYNLLGITQGRLDRIDQAIASFSEALALRPDFPDAQRNLENARGLKVR